MTDSSTASRVRQTPRVSSASVEVSSRGHQVGELRERFRPGLDVTITSLPGDDYHHTVETAAALRRSGFNPVPHIAAREMPSRSAFDDFLARVRGEADVTRVLLIAGDVFRAKGPYRSSLDLCESGLIEAHGIGTVSIAGHPEGHPQLDREQAFRAIAARRDWGHGAGVGVDIVSQFCFESAPIVDWMNALRAAGLDLPVIIGLAGPATPATLLKFALRCGIGTSLKSLRSHIGSIGRLASDAGPDDVVHGLLAAPASATAALAGFHLFPFGGLRKTSDWLKTYRDSETLPQREHPIHADCKAIDDRSG